MERARPAWPPLTAHRQLPFFPDLHEEIAKSWKQLFSACTTNVAVSGFTNIVGSVEQVCACLSAVEETLAVRLLLSLASSWKARPVLPTKPRKTTSALIVKSYMAGGQAERHLWLNRAAGQCQGYTTQFWFSPPCFNRVLPSDVTVDQVPVLEQEVIFL